MRLKRGGHLKRERFWARRKKGGKDKKGCGGKRRGGEGSKGCGGRKKNERI